MNEVTEMMNESRNYSILSVVDVNNEIKDHIPDGAFSLIVRVEDPNHQPFNVIYENIFLEEVPDADEEGTFTINYDALVSDDVKGLIGDEELTRLTESTITAIFEDFMEKALEQAVAQTTE